MAEVGIKPSPEVFQFLVRLSDVSKEKIDLKDVAQVMGTKYKSAWDGFNRAKKDLAAAGYMAPSMPNSPTIENPTVAAKTKGKAATSNPKKRKSSDNDDDEEGDTKTVADEYPSPQSEKKKQVGRPAKVIKKEAVDDAVTAVGGDSGSKTEADGNTSPVVEKKKRGPKAKSPVKKEEALVKKEEESDKEVDGGAAPTAEKKKRGRPAAKKPVLKEEVSSTDATVAPNKGTDVTGEDGTNSVAGIVDQELEAKITVGEMGTDGNVNGEVEVTA